MVLHLLLAASGVTFSTVEHAGDRFHVVDVDPKVASVRLHWKKSAEEVRVEAPEAVAVTNAGIYEPGFVPTGLLVIDGKARAPLNLREGQGNFFMKPNGIFTVTKTGAAVVESSAYGTVKDVVHATQSGPMLVHEGKVNAEFSPKSTNVAIRSAVGVARNGHVLIVISVAQVRLFSIGSLFREKLDCPEALYLDGAISSLWAPELKLTAPANYPYAAMISVSPARSR